MYFLVRDIISINTHVMVMTTYDEFQSSTKMVSQGQSHTQTIYNVESSQSKNNCVHCTQLSPQEIN